MRQLTRRAFLVSTGSAALMSSSQSCLLAQNAQLSFSDWVEAFRSRAKAHGVSNATYDRVMHDIKPDISVYALDKAQPEFHEEVWQYLNRRVSDWRIVTGKERAREHADLLARVEREYGVDRYIMLGLWGMETAFGDVVLNPKHMRPILPALAALAWGEPRRRSYWEQELLNALVLIERGWAVPKDMIGSWAGAMGHTQWMPEVWLNMGVDFDKDGRISPFGPPDDALAGTAQYILKRGRYRQGERWGYEINLPSGISSNGGGMRNLGAWSSDGIKQADGKDLPNTKEQARLWQPVSGGPAFLLSHNFDAVKSYNPANTYALAIVHLGDRIKGAGTFKHQFPGGERILTLVEVQEMQQRLTASGFDTDGTDGRVGNDTMRAIRNFQKKVGLEPADGYAGLKVLAKLRERG